MPAGESSNQAGKVKIHIADIPKDESTENEKNGSMTDQQRIGEAEFPRSVESSDSEEDIQNILGSYKHDMTTNAKFMKTIEKELDSGKKFNHMWELEIVEDKKKEEPLVSD